MITCSIIQKSQLEGNLRLDAEYYQPEYLEIGPTTLKGKLKVIGLGDIASEIKYGTSENLEYPPTGTPFLRVTDVNDIFTIDPENGKFILPSDAMKLKEYRVYKGDILISRTGTLGLAVFIDERLEGSIYGSCFIKVSIRDKRFNNEFITVFLNSRFGQLQTAREASGGIQTNLTIGAIKSFNVPILPKSSQQKIADLVRKSHEARKKSKELLEVAKKKVEEMIESPSTS